MGRSPWALGQKPISAEHHRPSRRRADDLRRGNAPGQSPLGNRTDPIPSPRFGRLRRQTNRPGMEDRRRGRRIEENPRRADLDRRWSHGRETRCRRGLPSQLTWHRTPSTRSPALCRRLPPRTQPRLFQPRPADDPQPLGPRSVDPPAIQPLATRSSRGSRSRSPIARYEQKTLRDVRARTRHPRCDQTNRATSRCRTSQCKTSREPHLTRRRPAPTSRSQFGNRRRAPRKMGRDAENPQGHLRIANALGGQPAQTSGQERPSFSQPRAT